MKLLKDQEGGQEFSLTGSGFPSFYYVFNFNHIQISFDLSMSSFHLAINGFFLLTKKVFKFFLY